MAFPYLQVIIGYNILIYLWETYLDIRQYIAHKQPTLPKPLEGVISQEKFEKSQAYSLDISRYRFVRKFVTIVLESAVLYFKLLPWLWKKSGEFLTFEATSLEKEILHTFVFLGVIMIALQIIRLPFSLYRTFVIEARYGFNKRTIWLFFKDKLMIIALTILIGSPIVAALIVIVQKGDPYYVIYLWGFTFAFSTAMMFIFPVLIAPLFNKFTPLPDGDLRTKIENLAASLKFPLKKLFVVDGSTRSSHSNVRLKFLLTCMVSARTNVSSSMTHCFNRHRVLQCKSDEEVVAILAHELGHWKLNHVLYGFIMNQILMVLLFGGYALIRKAKVLFHSFGFHDTHSAVVALIIFWYTVVPLERLVYFVSRLVSRCFEFQADAYAKKLGYAKEIRESLITWEVENLPSMNPDPWYSAYHYTHPPLIERLAAIEKSDTKDTNTSSAEGKNVALQTHPNEDLVGKDRGHRRGHINEEYLPV